MEAGTVQYFPESLISVDLSDNIFTIGHYVLCLKEHLSITSLDSFDNVSPHKVSPHTDRNYAFFTTWSKSNGMTPNINQTTKMNDYTCMMLSCHMQMRMTLLSTIHFSIIEKNGEIQLCLQRRNFLPGNYIATNNTSAIHNSRKTIVIMSANYLASHWCMFEYNMAKMESIYERNCENILFLVFYKQMSACDLPLKILEQVHCQSYIECSDDENGDVVFGNSLKRQSNLTRNNNLSYSLFAAFVLLINFKQVAVHEVNEWKACHFARSCLCKNIIVSEQFIADCSGKHLLRIPRLPNKIQELSLRNNNISTIQNGIFVGNSLLTTLDLSFNRISLIRNNSFKGLTNVLSLNLSNNDLKYEHKSFEYSAFYFFVPDLWKLRSLESLSIDYVSDTIAIFNEKFANLKNLTSVDLSGFTGNCKMTILTENTFLFLSQITHLNLSKCKIQHIFKGTFKLLTNLLELDVSLNTCLRFETLENITTDLQYSAIKNLKVNYIHGIFGMPTILKTSHILNLRNTSLSLVRFEAAGNLIQRIEYGALKYLPKSLESADMRDNVFSIGKYMPDLRSLPITSLDISNIRSSHNVVISYIEHCDSRNDTVMIDSENNWLFQQLQYLEVWKSLKYGFPVPRGLKTVSLRSSNLKYEIPNFIFIKNQLENISVSDNVLHTWTGPITNVKRLKFLDLSSNFWSNVSKTFFSPDFVNLRYLLLQNNLLGLILPTDVDGEIFQNLHNVVYINLSKIEKRNYQIFYLKSNTI
ncbi:unnamed protein product [Mytilus edulis]|uniref:TIR domain-containing protein n=1 Tax=Mytilus edulis TaxID=6550 RepID=A0A8S3RB17_MYTED|nr:unnamed protein product [Mytilus edulis]